MNEHEAWLYPNTWLLNRTWYTMCGQVHKRFSELKRSVSGITQRTLAQQLRDLQSTGIVERTVYPDRPPRVVYAVTPLGKSLRPLLDAMCHWGRSHSAAMAMKKLRASDRLQ